MSAESQLDASTQANISDENDHENLICAQCIQMCGQHSIHCSRSISDSIGRHGGCYDTAAGGGAGGSRKDDVTPREVEQQHTEPRWGPSLHYKRPTKFKLLAPPALLQTRMRPPCSVPTRRRSAPRLGHSPTKAAPHAAVGQDPSESAWSPRATLRSSAG